MKTYKQGEKLMTAIEMLRYMFSDGYNFLNQYKHLQFRSTSSFPTFSKRDCVRSH